jgi:dTDP-4-dehydrorhamnose reductase
VYLFTSPENAMRLLITGSSGLLGLNLTVEAMTSHEVIGVDRSTLKSAPFRTIQADLLDEGVVDSVLNEARPDWLVHCAALADLEACEENPEAARRLNADLPSALAKACKTRGIHMVQVSTDAVFDGTKSGIYTEEDEPHAVNIYSKTKLEGERAVLESNADAIVARVNFYGWSLGGRRSLAEFFFNNLSNNKSMSGYTDVIFCPMHATHLSQTLLAMLAKGLRGLYHAVGPQPMSKYQFGVEIARKFGLDDREISPKSIQASSLIARRAHNLFLSVDKLSTDLGQSLPSFSTGLDLFYTQFQEGFPQKLRSYAQ